MTVYIYFFKTKTQNCIVKVQILLKLNACETA